MAAFEMSVGDSLCKRSTTDREGGRRRAGMDERMQERRFGKRMQEIRK